MKRMIKSATNTSGVPARPAVVESAMQLEAHIFDENKEEVDCYYFATDDVEYVLDSSISDAEEYLFFPTDENDVYRPFSVVVTPFDTPDKPLAEFDGGTKIYYDGEED